MGATARTLSKSDFKLARSCDAKLYFRENGYPDNRDGNAYLALLADGGYMVEALAKARLGEGIQLDYGRNVADDFARTLEYLKQDKVRLFEATFLVGRRQARIDVLEKDGNNIRLIEIKSKSFDGAEHEQSLKEGKKGAFRGKRAPHAVSSDWVEKVEDLAFQMLLVQQVMPGAKITPFLALVDKSKIAQIDNIPMLFELVRNGDRVQTARYTGPADTLNMLDLVTVVDMSEEVAQLRADVEDAAARFESLLDADLAAYRPHRQIDHKCAKCEYRAADGTERNGFAECWGSLGTPKPHMLDLFSIGNARGPTKGVGLAEWLVSQKKTALADIPEDLLTKADGTVGPNAERQRRQVEYARTGEIYVGRDLRGKIDALTGPMHFIDFETSQLALPYHRNMNPYGLIAFQWSHHRTDRHGATPVHSEWLNDSELWPNQSFVESLRNAIGDEGPVLTWSKFEGTTLNRIVPHFARFRRDVPDLIEWIDDVVNRRIVDLHDWAKADYYHPAMGGRTSIKVVLDAIWRSDEAMRAQFETWTGLKPDASKDPYAALPSVVIGGTAQDVHEGTGAMRAYQEMMYGLSKTNPEARNGWAALLKQYCKLDTLSMVLILEHWRRVVHS